jgi:DNA gyrase subunit B
MIEDLDLLDAWTCIRHRPGMYIGSTGPCGLHYIFTDLVGVSLSEHERGFCQNIRVTLHKDGSITLEDDGRAPQQPLASRYLQSYLGQADVASTERSLDSSSSCSFGTFAMVCTAALSAWLRFEIRDSERRWQTRCEAPADIRPDDWEDTGPCAERETGITCHFLPDPAVFGTTTWDSGILLNWLWEQVHLYPGITITFTDEREGCEPQVLCAPDGLRELLPWCLEGKTPIHPTVIAGEGTHEGVRVELALSFIEEDPTWRVYVCGIPMTEGGTPLIGLRTGLSRTLSELSQRSGISFQTHRARLGVAAIVSVWLDHPIFSSPMKDRPQNPEAEIAVARVVREALLTHARNHPAEMQAIIAAL